MSGAPPPDVGGIASALGNAWGLISGLRDALFCRDHDAAIEAVLVAVDAWFLDQGDVSASRAAMMLTQHHRAEPDEAPMLTCADVVRLMDDHTDVDLMLEIKVQRDQDGVVALLSTFVTNSVGDVQASALRALLHNVMDTEEAWTLVEGIVREVAEAHYLHLEREGDGNR